MPSTFPPSSTAAEKKGGGCAFFVFCLFWTLISGSIFVFSLYLSLRNLHSDETKNWVATPCVLERFEIRENADGDSPRFIADAAYHYSAHGADFTGQKVWLASNGSDHYRDLGKVREALLKGPEVEGTAASCVVDPADPSRAVLLASHGPGRAGAGGLIMAGVSGLFLLLGVLLFVAERKKQGKNASDATDGVDEKTGAGASVLIVFFLIFALAGGGLACWMGSQAVESFGMRKWQAVEATIVSSKVSTHDDDDGPTYGIDLFYRYDVAGKTYYGDRYRLVGSSSSNHGSKQAYVAQHPPGSKLTAYYDPADPWQSIVQRDWGGEAWWLLFPLPFLGIGVGGLIWTIRKIREPRVASGMAAVAPSSVRRAKGSRTTGQISYEPLLISGQWRLFRGVSSAAIVFLVFLALFWNSITWVMILSDWKGPSEAFDWFHLVFMIPFAVIGVGLFVGIFFAALGAGAASFEVMLDRAELAPGESTRLTWRRSGGRGQPRSFMLFLVGKESATYAKGSSRSTDTSVFHETKLYETSSAASIQAGSVELVIPADAVPGFEGKNNAIRWEVRLLYDMGRWRKYSPGGLLTIVSAAPSNPSALS